MTLGLDSHLDPNAIHQVYVIKYDSDCKKYKNNNFKQYNIIQFVKNILLEVIDAHAYSLECLNESVVTPLTRSSNTPKWFFMRQLFFTSSAIYRIYATLIRTRTADLENISFNKVHLDLLFNHIKSFNLFKTFDNKMIEDALFIDVLKHNTQLFSNQRQSFAEKVIEKDGNNKYAIN